jgi:acetate kinase
MNVLVINCGSTLKFQLEDAGPRESRRLAGGTVEPIGGRRP